MGIITKFNITDQCDFGSQMTQYACLISICKKTGLKPVFVEELLNGILGFSLNQPFINPIPTCSLSEIQNEDIFEISLDSDYPMDERLFLLDSNKNYNISDLFLSNDYFYDIKEEIIETFTFKNEINQFCLEYIDKVKPSEDEILVGIHFRRGDYLIYSSLNLSLNYYYDAVKTIQGLFPNKKIKYLIFSNEMEWVKENFQLDNCIYVENLDRFKDMCLMSLCDHMIIANSSFSWWGAFLNKNPNKKIVCPYYYLNVPQINSIVNGKYYPKEWISINSI